jgi:3-oxoacyl-[acyl-carrier protein] reductase
VDLGLNGKVALVTASSKGLGKASALALAREGARVTICARTEADLEAAAEEIQDETHAEVLAIQADLTTAEGIESVVPRRPSVSAAWTSLSTTPAARRWAGSRT